MSWDHWRYKVTCDSCGHVGVCIRSENDWFQHEAHYEGFIERAPDRIEVGRKRVGPSDMRPQCPKCHGMLITIDQAPIKED